MTIKAGVYLLRGNSGAQMTCPQMLAGVRACGDEATLRVDTEYNGPEYDVAIFWGYVETCQAIMRGYREANKPVVYLDLGYWKRATYYKVAVNARHPTAYFRNKAHDNKRRFGVGVQAWRFGDGHHLLLAGMGSKAAWAEKCEPVESWERSAVTEIRKYTDRPIIYRPKPSWWAKKGQTKLIPGVAYSPPEEKVEEVLANAWAVVTHHSNVAVDGLVFGVPAFALYGVAAPMGLPNYMRIEHPWTPPDREEWLNDVSYTQWSLEEMRDGKVWRHLKEEGLVP